MAQQDYVTPPPTRTAVDEFVNEKPLRVARAWVAYFERVFDVCFAQSQSGTTAQRPSAKLYIGRRYFDTTLGFPVWYSGTEWVDATGAAA